MSASSELSLEVDQLIAARPDTVFALLTDPSHYVRWFGPPGATVTIDEMTVALGGRLAITVTFPDSDFRVGIEGFYEAIEPPLRLTHTWRIVGEEAVTAVSFELEPQGDSTRLRVTHRGFVDPLELEQNQGGWLHHLTVLGALAADVERSRR